ncbi:HAD hydrolase-like protein [Actinoallomurus sp. CA-150999]|uniref:HAD hydrolase-like protein n=1 Tax=Actinoallomurus sp. CA-150999 TaxID=3239887 RepID=UPI003D94A0C9
MPSGTAPTWAVATWSGIQAGAFEDVTYGAGRHPYAGSGQFTADPHSVVSAASAAAVRADMTALGLTSLWDFTAFGVTRKDTMLRRRATGQEHTVYVGDTEYDIHSARAAGCVAVGIPSGYCSASRLTAAGVDHLITDFSQLTTLLTTLLTTPEKEALS